MRLKEGQTGFIQDSVKLLSLSPVVFSHLNNIPSVHCLSMITKLHNSLQFSSILSLLLFSECSLSQRYSDSWFVARW